MIKKSKKLNNRPADLPLAFTPNVYEIHGNVFYMHCSREEEPHSRDFFPCPKLSEVTDKKNHVPRCTYPGCNAVMKPHCMFFDEMYSEHYYRKDTVDAFVKDADCCIVVGTALQTNFAKKIVEACLDKEEDAIVIEINLEQILKDGNVAYIQEKSEIALPTIFEEFYKLSKSDNDKKRKKTKSPPKNKKF